MPVCAAEHVAPVPEEIDHFDAVPLPQQFGHQRAADIACAPGDEDRFQSVRIIAGHTKESGRTPEYRTTASTMHSWCYGHFNPGQVAVHPRVLFVACHRQRGNLW